jgi:DNA-binding transcriptional LysR family regulator
MLRAAIVHVQRTLLHAIRQHSCTMLDLRRLRLLRELEARGTVGAVAAALSYSPSAVSQGLAALERQVGVALLEPAGRGVRLTEAGRLLAGRADALLRGAEEAEAALAALAGTAAGTVRIAAFQTATLRIVAPAARALAAAHPALRLEVVEAELEEAVGALRAQALDVVLGEEYDGLPAPRPPGLAREVLLRERVRLVLPAAHPLAAEARVPLAALADAAWATGQPGTGQRELVLRACRELGGFEPDLRHRTNDLLILLAMVGTVGAVTLLPDLVRAEGDPAVAVRELAEDELGREIFLLARRESVRRPAVAAVLAALRSAAPDRPPDARP